MFEEYMTWWHFKALIVYLLANSALPWYAMWRNKCLKPNPNRDVERFQPWVRIDYDTWNPWIVPVTHFFFLIRYLIFFSLLIFALTTTSIICIGADINNLSQFRKRLILSTT